MSDPVAFMIARLSELAEKDWHVFDCSGMPWEDGHCCDAQRWLAREAAAQRKILAMWQEPESERYLPTGEMVAQVAVSEAIGSVVRILAEIDSDHPDYDPAWAER